MDSQLAIIENDIVPDKGTMLMTKVVWASLGGYYMFLQQGHKKDSISYFPIRLSKRPVTPRSLRTPLINKRFPYKNKVELLVLWMQVSICI